MRAVELDAKAEHRVGRNHLAGTHGDAANAVLAAAGYNFRRLLEAACGPEVDISVDQ